jgi:hypothetical protein
MLGAGIGLLLAGHLNDESAARRRHRARDRRPAHDDSSRHGSARSIRGAVVADRVKLRCLADCAVPAARYCRCGAVWTAGRRPGHESARGVGGLGPRSSRGVRSDPNALLSPGSS